MCAHSMVHSDESRTGQQRKVLQGDTLRSFLANVGQSLLSSAQAPIPVVISIGIVRGAFPLAMGVASDERLMGTIVHHARYPHTEARMCSAALMYIRAACAASHACAWPRDNEPWADRPGRSHRERIMTERLIQDNETPPLSASLKMVVKSATTSATTCGCIHWTYIFYSLEQAPGTEAHFSSEAALSTWWYPQQT